jgi:hypothetical protein
VKTPDTAARRALGACAALMIGALTLTGCGGDAQADNQDEDGKGGMDSARVSAAKIAISAKDGSAGASINTTGVEVSDGRLTEVRMTVARTGAAVPGAISPRTAAAGSRGNSWSAGRSTR